MTIDDLNATEARAKAATPGPWRIGTNYQVIDSKICDDSICEVHSTEQDIEFIAHARIDIPNLIAFAKSLLHRAEKAEAEVIRLQALL